MDQFQFSGIANAPVANSRFLVSSCYQMKNLLIKIFWPILNKFEEGEGEYNYTPSRRIILLVVGPLFLLLSVGMLGMVTASGELVVAIPVLVFFAVGFVAMIVGTLGSDRAVAKIWGNK